MNEDAFLIFCLGFYLFGMYIVISFQRNSEDRRDRRDDVAYNRELSEKREFGFQNVVDAKLPTQKPSRFRKS